MLTHPLFSRWFSSPDKLIEGGKTPSAVAIASPSISVHNETNNITNILAPAVAVAASEGSD